MSFTFHEAQTQMLDNLDPLFKVLTSAILPDAMAASFAHHIVDQLNDMAKGQTSQPFVITVAAGEGAGLRAVLAQNFPVEVKVREDADVGPGQAYLRLGDAEREIDSSALLASIHESVDAFTYQVQEEAHYG
jgi:flagellar assembly protein FliH